MKLVQLANYCETIEINCDICEHKKECEIFTYKLEEISPFGLIDLVNKNPELK